MNVSVVRFTDFVAKFSLLPRDEEPVSKLRVPAPKARNVIAWAIGPGGISWSFPAPKARNDLYVK